MAQERAEYPTREERVIEGNLKGLNLKLRAIIGLMAVQLTGATDGIARLLEPGRQNIGHHENLHQDREQLRGNYEEPKK